MLGAQSWYLALSVPTVVIGAFIASRKRLAFQWREELMDPDGNIYPTVLDADMGFLRRVAPEQPLSPPRSVDAVTVDGHLGTALGAKENFGFCKRVGGISPPYGNALLTEVRRLADKLGNASDPRRVAALRLRVKEEYASREDRLLKTFDTRSYSDLRIISDHAVDTMLMKAPWGCGDSMALHHMPSPLRYLVERTKDAFPGIGRLRHVHIEYSSRGNFYCEPRIPKAFDGHDYVIIPLRRDGADTVVTFSPILRSKYTFLGEVMRHSWTNRDVDALLPANSMLRVYGTARYEWGWGLRPGTPWFGSPLNRVKRPDLTGDYSCRWWQRLCWPGKDYSSNNQLPAKGLGDAAMVVLHFEGPRGKDKTRSLLLHPERWIFGPQPTVETFEQWVNQRPSAELVQQEGLVGFLARNYFDMLRVS